VQDVLYSQLSEHPCACHWPDKVLIYVLEGIRIGGILPVEKQVMDSHGVQSF